MCHQATNSPTVINNVTNDGDLGVFISFHTIKCFNHGRSSKRICQEQTLPIIDNTLDHGNIFLLHLYYHSPHVKGPA